MDLSFPASLAGLDSANGWGPFHFGARWSDWPATVRLLPGAQNGQVSGVVPRYGLLVGGVWLAGVRLNAYNGQLATLWFGPSSEADAEELLAQLTTRYGQGQVSGYHTVTWPGAVVSLIYEPLVIARGGGRNVHTTTLGRLGLRSNMLQAQAVADKATERTARHAAR